MLKELFKTKEEKELAIANFKALLNTQGWMLIEQVIDANIKEVREQILNGTENETKETIDRLRDKLKVHEAVRDTPTRMIREFSVAVGEELELDPYLTKEQLIEERKKIV